MVYYSTISTSLHCRSIYHATSSLPDIALSSITSRMYVEYGVLGEGGSVLAMGETAHGGRVDGGWMDGWMDGWMMVFTQPLVYMHYMVLYWGLELLALIIYCFLSINLQLAWVIHNSGWICLDA